MRWWFLFEVSNPSSALLQDHQLQCDFSTVECPQCQGTFPKNHLKEHMTQECPRRQVCCPNCATSMAYEDKEVLSRSLSLSTCFHMGLLGKATAVKKKPEKTKQPKGFGLEELFVLLHSWEATNSGHEPRTGKSWGEIVLKYKLIENHVMWGDLCKNHWFQTLPSDRPVSTAIRIQKVVFAFADFMPGREDVSGEKSFGDICYHTRPR